MVAAHWQLLDKTAQSELRAFAMESAHFSDQGKALCEITAFAGKFGIGEGNLVHGR